MQSDLLRKRFGVWGGCSLSERVMLARITVTQMNLSKEAHCGKMKHSLKRRTSISERNYYLAFIFKNEKLQFVFFYPSLMYLSCSKELKIDSNFDMIRL